jgi:hypothetical protein
MSKKVFFLVRNNNYVLDCMRSALGQAVENNFAFCAVVGSEVDELDEHNKENLEWIRDMEGEVYSDNDANVAKNEFVKISLEEIGQKLKEMDVVVPYGVM